MTSPGPRYNPDMKRLMRVTCALSSVTVLYATALAEKLAVHVYDVLSGDTIGVRVHRKPLKIHLWGVAAPVAGQPHMAQAKKFFSDLILGKDVIVDIRGVESNGDRIAKILWTKLPADRPGAIPPTVDIGREMVSAGLAWWNPTEAQAASDLKAAEDTAKKGKKGLWADPHPVAPWTYGKPKTKPTGKPTGKPTVKPKHKGPAGPARPGETGRSGK